MVMPDLVFPRKRFFKSEIYFGMFFKRLTPSVINV